MPKMHTQIEDDEHPREEWIDDPLVAAHASASASPKDLHLTMQIRNNLLRSRRISQKMSCTDVAKATGISLTSYCKMEKLMVSPLSASVLRQCREPNCDSGANYPSRMLCKEHAHSPGSSRWPMKRSPATWTPMALALAKFYKVNPAELFPGSILAVEVSKHEKEVNWEDVAPYLGSDHSAQLALPPDETVEKSEAINAVLSALDAVTSPRNKAIVLGLAEGDSLESLAKEFGVCSGSIKAIAHGVMQKLHRQVRLGSLRAFAKYEQKSSPILHNWICVACNAERMGESRPDTCPMCKGTTFFSTTPYHVAAD